eukprot:TRINITY_DN9919_c0_g1_i1.p1 TRINITY_DN9919_c0_g1~~TRINITY_DN9919_c0_g1_i1.p1  ORF type:complete len:143 (+),score=20.22 TRINITY_DN9919_c0_g1_i1:58-486(+)
MNSKAIRTALTWRFFSTILHLIMVLLAFSSRKSNILTELPLRYKQSEYDDLEESVYAGLILSTIFLGTEILTMIFGLSLFKPFLNIIQSLIHGCGFIITAFYVGHDWEASSIWGLFGTFCVIPMLLELFAGIASHLRQPRLA